MNIKLYFWFLFKEKVLYVGKGLYSSIKVTKKGCRYNLYTGDNFLQTSILKNDIPTGSFFDWYLIAPWFDKNFNGNISNMAVLGLGGGSQVSLYNSVYSVKHITGVELDPKIIEVANKYFDLCAYKNLNIVNSDAFEFLKNSQEKFNLIIVDTFKKDMFEINNQSLKFIETARNCLSTNGILFINKLRSDGSNSDLEISLQSYFSFVYKFNVFETSFYIATSSATAVRNTDELISSAIDYSKKLLFFKKLRKLELNLLATKH